MNPPFVPETLLKAAEHANTLLDAADFFEHETTVDFLPSGRVGRARGVF